LMQQSQIIRFIRVNKEKSEFHPAETLIFQQVNDWQKSFIRFYNYFLILICIHLFRENQPTISC
jgi:hypothetical protein